MPEELWVEKYKPKTLYDIVGNREEALRFGRWLEARLKGEKVKRAALLWGPPGTGKTLTVEVAARQYKLELIEMNASDFRTEAQVLRIAGSAAAQGSLFGMRGKLILLDEVDGISGREDKGGLAAILNLIDVSAHPVVLTANDPWDPAFRSLRDKCEMFRYNRIRETSIVAYLRKICQMEGIKAEDSALKFIAQRTNGDVRAALNDLQAATRGTKILRLEDVKWVSYRDHQQTAFEVLRRIFSARSCKEAKAATIGALIDFDLLIKWINENIPYQYTDPEELSKAYDALSKADIYYSKVKKLQQWELFSYVVDFATAGVAAARKHPFKFVKYQFPKDILVLSATKEERQIRQEILEKIRQRCHISRRRAVVEYLPYLQVIAENNPEMAKRIAKWLKLSKEAERKLLAGEVMKLGR